ncbi:MAG: hypothetical protein RLZZ398_1982 [Verrucomicrobiota bacterium]|jgi:hypothetical protein
MIDFLKRPTELMLRYTPEREPDDWLAKRLEHEELIPISSKTFYVSHRLYRQQFEDPEFAIDSCYHFVVGVIEGNYYRIEKSILRIDFDLLMHRSLDFKRSTFVAERNISIFRRLQGLNLEQLRIGGDHPEALPAESFVKLLRKFPNTWELNRYAAARITSILREHLPIQRDHDAEYQHYMNKRATCVGSNPRRIFAAYEVDKYTDLVARIEAMLGNSDAYNERQWQLEILQVILFLFPKYIASFREAPVRDSLAEKDRFIDFLLVDASGYIDGLEIKKPFAECMVTKTRYRDNHVPMRELNGTVMQLEKYLFHLNRWGQQGEKKLNERYSSEIPPDVRIQIVNPSGMIIMGRDHDWTQDQRTDFEVIRRKYRHVVEIMTYDDLLRRLKAIRDQFKAITAS